MYYFYIVEILYLLHICETLINLLALGFIFKKHSINAYAHNVHTLILINTYAHPIPTSISGKLDWHIFSTLWYFLALNGFLKNFFIFSTA